MSETKCPWCAGTLDEAPLWSVTDRLRRVSEIFVFHRCTCCESAVLDPLPDDETLRRAYPAEYVFRSDKGGVVARAMRAVEVRLFHAPVARSEAEHVRALTVSRDGRKRGVRRLLDVGCGEGYRVAMFRESGIDAEGLELSPEAAARARERWGFKVWEGPLETVAATLGDPYDALTFFDVLEHLVTPDVTLAAARDVLGEGGWVLARVPVTDALTIRLLGQRHVFVRDAPRHVSIPSRRGLEHTFQRAGFTVESWLPTTWMVSAGAVGLSLVTGADYASAGSGGLAGYVARRAGAALCGLVAGTVPALIESLQGTTAEVMILARKR